MIDNYQMFYDYYRGCSQRELEKKYNCSSRSISAYCKKVMTHLFNNKSSIIGGNLDRIEQEIKNTIMINMGE